MKVKLLMARLLVIVMLLNSVLPAYASVNGMSGFVTETETSQSMRATPSDAEMMENVEVEDDVDDAEIENGINESLDSTELQNGIALLSLIDEDGSDTGIVITKQPETYWGEGDEIVFIVEAEGDVTYQWYFSKDGEVWTEVTETEGTDFTTNELTVVWPEDEEEDIEDYLYRCKVENEAGESVNSDVAEIHITPFPVVMGEWVKDSTGWMCLDEDGYYYSDEFAVFEGEIYYLNDDGYMAKEVFIEVGDGSKTHTYYVDESGVLATNRWVPVVDEGETYWRYMQSNGRAAKSIVKVFGSEENRKVYAFDDNAFMMTGWVNKTDGTLTSTDDWKNAQYYFSESENVNERGIRASGWTTINVNDGWKNPGEDAEHTFYFNSSGIKVTGRKQIDENWYGFDSTGARIEGWAFYSDELTVNLADWKEANRYYDDETGVMVTGWLTKDVYGGWRNENDIDTYKFYFTKSGQKLCSTVNKINYNKYYFDETGAMWNGMENVEIDGERYDINANGVLTAVGSGNGGSDQVYGFATMEELKELLADENKDNRVFVYYGDTAFTVDEDLVIPNYINFQFHEEELIIEEGVTFTINNWMNCGKLTVNGTMIANGQINVEDSLSVNGKLESPEHNIAMTYPAAINGLQNIVFGDEGQEHHYMQVTVLATFTTAAELVTLVEDISKDPYRNEERVGYRLQIEYNDDTIDTFEINEDIEIPEHIGLELCNVGEVIIPEGNSLTNYGELIVLVPLTVSGKLENNGVLSVSNDRDFCGTLSLKGAGTYSGNGEFQVHTDEAISDLDEVLFGFDLDAMCFKSNTDNEGNTHWHLDTSGSAFATFAQLVNMAESDTISGYRWRYVGTAPLEIEEDLTIPKGISLDLDDRDLIVPSGVTFTVHSSVDCANLIVAGTMNASEWIYANESVSVSGTLNADRALNAGYMLDIADTGVLNVNQNTIQMNYPGELAGLDRINFAEEWQSVRFQAQFEDMDELAELAAELATNYIEHKDVSYSLQMPWNNADNAVERMSIDQDITIPAHVEFQLNSNREFTIEENATVTIDGTLSIAVPLTVKGALINNGNVIINNRPNEQNSEEKGSITLGTNGSYTGKGTFYVNVDSGVAGITSVLFGFKLDDYDITEDIWNDGSKQWRVNYAGGLIKLGTPKNLKWGVEYQEEWISIEGTDDFDVVLNKIAKNGAISWETVTPDQAEVQIHIYRVGESQPCMSERWGFGVERQPQFRSVDSFQAGDMESGSYYFTVQSLGDYKEYRNSDVAKSDVYTYVKPNAKLNTCTGLTWDDRNDQFVTWIDWDDNTDTQYLDGYQVEIYYSATGNANDYRQYSGMRGRGNIFSEDPLDADIFQYGGIGYYKYRVRALSKDIEVVGNSEWSAFSPVLDMKKIPEDVNDELSDILDDVKNNNMSQKDIRDAVQSMDTGDLLAALATDQDNTGATQKLAELEQKAGGAAAVEVTQNAAAFNPTEISVVGANLNNQKAGTSEPIKLVVDKPEEEHVIPELYNSSVAVKFSMNLENVENPEELDVPVKITLPIPASINPEFAVIFHYHADGSYEVIHPYVYTNNGKWFADIVLTSFSDFVLTSMHDLEKVEAKPATYTSEGNIEYYICNCCGELFADAEAKNAITVEATIIPKKQASTGSSRDDDDEENVSSKKPAASTALPEYVVSGQWTVADGKWAFTDAAGEVYKNKWAAVENPYANTAAGQAAFDWFFFDANGQMMTGWVLDGGRWYYLNPASDGTQGCMMTGWQLIDGKWYYLNPVSDGTKGAMVVDTWIDTYYVDVNGVWDAAKTK